MTSKAYIISYDLNSPGQDYSKLYEKIKSLGKWWHHLDSTWIVKSDKKASEIRDYLADYLDKNDELIVIKLGDSWAGIGFEKRAYDWLHDNAYEK